MNFSGLGLLLSKVSINFVRKAMLNHLTHWYAQKTSSVLSGLITWFTVIKTEIKYPGSGYLFQVN